MVYVIDGILLLILVLSAIIGARRGFIKALCGFGATVLAFVVSFTFKSRLGQLLSDGFFHDFLYGKVYTYIQGVADSVNATGESLSQALNKGILKFAKIPDMTLIGNESIDDITSKVTDSISSSFSSAAAFVILFFASLIIITLLLKVLDKICDLPMLSQLNGLLGFVIGLVKGLLICFVVSLIFKYIYPYLNIDGMVAYDDMLASTYIFRLISVLNPFNII